MTFLNAALLWTGLALAAGPILIHLLHRRRFRVREWAAMEFLLESLRRNRRRLRIEELLLLALRVLLIVLMGAALARPFLGERSLATVLGMQPRAEQVILLDDSYSMAQRIGIETAFDRARAVALKLLERVAPEDTLTVLLCSRAQPLFGPAHRIDATALRAELEALTPSDFGTDLVRPLEQAAEIFRQSKHPEQRLYLLSDFRLRDWEFSASGSGHRARTVWDTLKGARLKISLLDFGTADAANLGVTELALAEKHAVRGMRAQFRAAVSNHGAAPARNVPVTIRVGDEEFPARVIESLAPGQTVTIPFSFTFSRAGAHAVSVSLPADALAPDNARHLALEVREAVRVLVVNGAPDQEPYVNETDYFVAALDPAGRGLTGYRPEVVSEAGLESVRFASYDAVVLANLARMPKAKREELEAFVAAGGGLAIFLGDRVDRDFYNGELFREGRGLMPLHLEPPRGDAMDFSKVERFQVDAVAHPVLGAFAALGGALLERVHVRVFFPSQQTDDTVKRLASFTDPGQSAAWVEKRFGQGRVLLFTSTISARWNDWPRHPSYPIAMNELVAYLARPWANAKTAPVGEPILREVEAEFLDGTIIARGPQAEVAPARLTPRAEGERFVVRYEQTERAGLYSLELVNPVRSQRDDFARNVDPSEGELAKIEASVLTQQLQGLPIKYFTQPDAAAAAAADPPRGKEFWRYFLGALLALMVLESFLALRFGKNSP